MIATHRPFTQIINGTTQFVIPVFQRDYSWSEPQCRQLWSDLLRVGGAAPGRTHFMGSMVYVAAGDMTAGFTRWLLVDGQQRLTTLTLLVLALRSHLVETNWEPPNEDGPTPDQLQAYFLRNEKEGGQRQHKVILRRHDQATLRALLSGDDLPPEGERSTRIIENLELFKELVADADPMDVYAGLNRLLVVDVTLDRHYDDPQLVFESLNSTGRDLTQADQIRNYILMRMPESEQTALYETYWRKIEDLFRNSDRTFDHFARDYMALCLRSTKQTRADEIYAAFREFYQEEEAAQGVQPILERMLRHGRHYAAFSLQHGVDGPVAQTLQRLRGLAEVAAILVMRLLECHEQGTLSATELQEALALLESYLFRRALCGLQTRGYWQVFAGIAHRLRDGDSLTRLKVALHRQGESYRFPNDEEFAEALRARNLYGMRICHYLLDRLENHGSKEPTDTRALSIEHVMPQNENLPQAWRDMLGPEWREAHRVWLHRLGNLTLTGYNSTYSDRAFEEKKTIAGGFSDSAVRLNRFVREQARWTPPEMEERTQLLVNRSLSIWRRLDVSDAALSAARIEDLQAKAAGRTTDQVPMPEAARALFGILREKVVGLSPSVIEIAESKSVSYHAADFFLEVLPRRHGLVLLLNMDFGECDDPDGTAGDATTSKFFFYASHSGGVYCRVDAAEQVEAAMHLVQQAYTLATL